MTRQQQPDVINSFYYREKINRNELFTRCGLVTRQEQPDVINSFYKRKNRNELFTGVSIASSFAVPTRVLYLSLHLPLPGFKGCHRPSDRVTWAVSWPTLFTVYYSTGPLIRNTYFEQGLKPYCPRGCKRNFLIHHFLLLAKNIAPISYLPRFLFPAQ